MGMPAPALPLRPVARDQLGELFAVLTHAFGEDFHPDDLELELLTAEADRSLAAFDGDRIVATAGIYTLDLAVPGARLPAAGVTWVGVAPTHRRRGLLTALMQRQLDDIHERGEPVAVLWASESSIYGRYGYGLASSRVGVEVERRAAALRPGLPGTDLRVDLVELEKALPVVAAVEEAADD